MNVDFLKAQDLKDAFKGRVVCFIDDEDNSARNFVLCTFCNQMMDVFGETVTIFTHNMFDLVYDRILLHEVFRRFPESAKCFGKPEFQGYRDITHRDIMDPSFQGTVLIQVDQRKDDILTSLHHMRGGTIILQVPNVNVFRWDYRTLREYAQSNDYTIVLLAPSFSKRHFDDIFEISHVGKRVFLDTIKSRNGLNLVCDDFVIDEMFNTYSHRKEQV